MLENCLLDLYKPDLRIFSPYRIEEGHYKRATSVIAPFTINSLTACKKSIPIISCLFLSIFYRKLNGKDIKNSFFFSYYRKVLIDSVHHRPFGDIGFNILCIYWVIQIRFGPRGSKAHWVTFQFWGIGSIWLHLNSTSSIFIENRFGNIFLSIKCWNLPKHQLIGLQCSKYASAQGELSIIV